MLEHRLERLRVVARPHLEGIQRETGETVNLVVLDADRVVYVDQVEGSRQVRMFTTVGTSVPAHTTGSGKAILANGPSEAFDALYGGREPLQKLTEHTLTTLDALEDDFARIRRRGYALDEEENELGAYCIGAPVFGLDREVVGAISISVPTVRLDDQRRREMIDAVVDTAGRISRELDLASIG